MCSTNLQCFCLSNTNLWVFTFELVPPTIARYSILDGVALIYVNFTIFIFNCCRLMESPHSPIINIYVITITSFSLVRMYLLASSFLIWLFHSSGQKWNSLECSMPYWSSIRNMSHSQQHPLLIPRLHLSTCLF